MAIYPARRRFTVAEYHQMAQAGILGEDDRLELIEGEIVEMTPIGRRHASCVNRLNMHLTRTFGDRAIVSVQNPVVLGEDTEPQPDLAVLEPEPDYYASGHPEPADVFFVVEVAQTSADPDRRVKVPLNARAGVAEVWLVDLEQDTITIYTDPTADGYHNARVSRRGESIAPTAFPDRSIDVAGILG